MKKLFNVITKIFSIAIAIVVLYIVVVYAAVFLPSFSRYTPSEARNKKFFKEKEFYENFLNEKTWFDSQNVTKLNIESFDGLNLVALNFPAEKDAVGTMILMHGYHSEPLREYVSLVHYYHELGYNIVLPYQRTHGLSEGRYITFGVRERYDLRDWINKVNSIYGEENPLFLQGISMGCATTVMTLGLDLPSNVRGAIADCGFTTPYEIIWKVLKKDMKIPTSSIIIKIGNVMTKVFAGFDMNEYSTYEAIEFNKKRENQIPVLFIHGTKDDFVPIEMTEQNFSRCLGSLFEVNGSLSMQPNPQIEKYKYIQIKDSPHAIENLIDPETYRKEVKTFLDKYVH